MNDTPATPRDDVTPSVAPGQRPHRNAFTAWLDSRFRTPAAIYGLLVFQAFIAIDTDEGDSVWDVLLTSFGTLIVFYIAHVFAHVLTEHGEHGLMRATWRSMQHAAGMIYAAIPATLTMIAAGLQGQTMDDAYDQTMWVTCLVLAILGYAAYAKRGAHILIRIVGALATAVLGAFIVLLEYAIH